MPSNIYPLIHTHTGLLQIAPQPMPNTQYGINTNYHPPTFEVNMTTFDNTPPVPNTTFDSNFYNLGSHPYQGSGLLVPHPFPNRNNHSWQVALPQEERQLLEPHPFPNRNIHPWSQEGSQLLEQDPFPNSHNHPWQEVLPQEESQLLEPDPFPKEGNQLLESQVFLNFQPIVTVNYDTNPWERTVANYFNFDSTHENREPDNTQELEYDEPVRPERRSPETGTPITRRLAFEHFEPTMLNETGHPQAPHPFNRFINQVGHRSSDTDQSDFKEIIYEEKGGQQENNTTDKSPTGYQMPPHPFAQHRNYTSSENEHFNRQDKSSDSFGSTLPDMPSKRQKVPHPFVSSSHSKDWRRSRDHYSSHDEHKDATQQEDVKKEQLNEATQWREPPENRSDDQRSNREDRRQTSDHTRRKEFYDRGGRSRRPPRSNRNDRSYETRPHDEDFRCRDFGRKQSTRTRHEDPTHSHWSDGGQSKTIPMVKNERGFQRGQAKSANFHQKPFEHQRHRERPARDRRDARTDRKSTQLHAKPQEDSVQKTSSSVLNEGLKDDSSCNEESGTSYSSKISNQRRKNSSSLSKQSYEDTSEELELSVMDKLVNEELSKKAALMSMEQSDSSPSGSPKKGKKDKRKDRNKDNPTSERKEETSETKKNLSGTKDKWKKKMQPEEVDTEPEPRIELNKSSEESNVRTGGVRVNLLKEWMQGAQYQMAEGLKLIDPRMEREKLNRSANDVVAQRGDLIDIGIHRCSEGSSQAM